MLNTDLTKKILDYSDVQALQVDFLKLAIIPQEVAEQSQTVIFDGEDKHLMLLSTNNYPHQLQALLKQLGNKGYQTDVYYIGTPARDHVLTRYEQLELREQKKRAAASAKQHAEGHNAIDLLTQLADKKSSYNAGDFIVEVIRLGYQSGASDLHFQSEKDGVSVKLRLDGVMHDIVTFSHEDFAQYAAKIKFMSGIKVNVTSMPHDGRFSFDHVVDDERSSIDVRINTMPSLYGDDIVIRYLDSSIGVQSFEELGVRDIHYQRIKTSMSHQHGLILVTGPTGSGKTTTLYSMLASINDHTRKIITLENPIEYQVPGIQQSQIDEDNGYTYEEGLKATLRHDPDIILVGETRSATTAETVINAALTGHLVFTTLHTNGAIESITRLLSMGVKPFLLAPSVHLVCAQRLVRQLCPHCSTRQEADFAAREEIMQTTERLSRLTGVSVPERDGTVPVPTGCDQCNHTGYLGRTLVMETLLVDDGMKALIIADNVKEADLYSYARDQGFVSLYEDGLMAVIEGKTTMDEVRKIM